MGEKFAKILESYDLDKYLPKVNEIVSGTVVNATKNEVIVDIDGFGTGIVRGREIEDESMEFTDVKPGDRVQATVSELENEMGYVELSFRKVGHQKAWQKLQEMKDKEENVIAKIIDANRGGLMVKIGNVLGFLPVSQLTIEHYPRVEGGDKSKILTKLKTYIGSDFRCKIIDINEEDEKLIVSEKSAWDEKQMEKVKNYKVGDIVKGTITGIVDFGIFVELADGVEGLVHISEIAWQRLDHPRDVVEVGQQVEARVIEIEGTKISLSIKQIKQDPWHNVEKKFKIGDTVKGKVLKVNPFGLFVELDDDIHGLAHISEIDKDKTPINSVKSGDVLEFQIVSIKPDEHRLGLSNKKAKEKKEKKSSVKEEVIPPTEDVKTEKKETTKEHIKTSNEEKPKKSTKHETDKTEHKTKETKTTKETKKPTAKKKTTTKK